jgi:hypothetical protein
MVGNARTFERSLASFPPASPPFPTSYPRLHRHALLTSLHRMSSSANYPPPVTARCYFFFFPLPGYRFVVCATFWFIVCYTTRTCVFPESEYADFPYDSAITSAAFLKSQQSHSEHLHDFPPSACLDSGFTLYGWSPNTRCQIDSPSRPPLLREFIDSAALERAASAERKRVSEIRVMTLWCETAL